MCLAPLTITKLSMAIVAPSGGRMYSILPGAFAAACKASDEYVCAAATSLLLKISIVSDENILRFFFAAKSVALALASSAGSVVFTL
ncbi:hypothetical protein D3C87_1536260 [compost metagenome]